MRTRKQLPLESLRPYLLEADPAIVPIDGPRLFGNAKPLEIEVGCGKGAFLLDRSVSQPEHNYLGIEIDRGLQLYIATRIAKRGLHHVRMLRAEALSFFRDCMAAASTAAIHIYFPDPWWKRRHHKRRLVDVEFAAQCSRVLQEDGRLYLATDVEEYFHTMLQVMAQVSTLLLTEDLPPLGVETNFARKAKLGARSVWSATYRNVTHAAADCETAAFSTRTI